MTLDMNPEIRARWTAALRSGDYSQGIGRLRRDGKFCCLGVLCDLAVKDGIVQWTEDVRWKGDYAIGDAFIFLPRVVADWAGLDEDDPMLRPANDDLDETQAAGMNDDGVSFAEIADLIDGGTP